MEHFGYVCDNQLIDKIFSSIEKRGSMSVKKLGDYLTHNLKENDITELINRENELIMYMNNYSHILNE